MRLIDLKLTNFRQHASSHLSFSNGLVGVLGPNGAGKSTLLEAIAWAIYGAAAARGTNDTLRFSKAPPRSRMEVELVFELGGHLYRVVRSMSNAAVYRDGADEPVAATLGGVTAYLEDRLGMTRDEFFNTYFTSQKELQFLASMGAADRGKFLSRVLGYERLREAQERARVARNALRSERDALARELHHGEVADRQRSEAEDALNRARADALAAGERLADTRQQLGALAPRWNEAEDSRERVLALRHRVEAERAAAVRVEAELSRLRQDLARAESAAREVEALKADLLDLPGCQAEVRQWAERHRAHERRASVEKELSRARQEIAATEDRFTRVSQAPILLERYRQEEQSLQEEKKRLDGSIERLLTDWSEARQEAEAQFRSANASLNEVRAQYAAVERTGPEGACSTCTRALGAEYERVAEALRTRGAELRDGLRAADASRKSLAEAPEALRSAREELSRTAQTLDEVRTRRIRCERAVEELESLSQSRDRAAARVAEIQAELGGDGAVYDAAAHQDAEKRLERLRGAEVALARAEALASRHTEAQTRTQQLEAESEEHRKGCEKLESELRECDFSESAYEALERQFKAMSEAARVAEMDELAAKGRESSAEVALAAAIRQQEMLAGVRVRIQELDHQIRVHAELDSALSGMRADVNALIRPELGEIASDFLSRLTDGRYQLLEIDEKYNMRVWDDGQPKSILSGGEEDVANLALRLALSQMIAERAGHPLQLLILDEVFGSLDASRRDNVVQLLRSLSDRFDQVVLITHVESLQDAMDDVVRIGYNETTGASVVGASGPDSPSPEPGTGEGGYGNVLEAA